MYETVIVAAKWKICLYFFLSNCSFLVSVWFGSKSLWFAINHRILRAQNKKIKIMGLCCDHNLFSNKIISSNDGLVVADDIIILLFYK